MKRLCEDGREIDTGSNAHVMCDVPSAKGHDDWKQVNDSDIDCDTVVVSLEKLHPL